MLHTITLDLPLLLPHTCDCCARHLIDTLRGYAGIVARLDTTRLVLDVDPQIVALQEAERLAHDAGRQVAQRYDHPTFIIDGMDCADCARNIERALTRIGGVHYATVNLTAAKLLLEYDRQQTSLDAISTSIAHLGYTARVADLGLRFVCSVAGLCCASEAEPIERALRLLPGVRDVQIDPTLARLSVAYDAGTVVSAQIVAQIEQLGFHVLQSDSAVPTAHQPPPRQWWQIRPRDLLTTLCGLLFAAAWLSAMLGTPTWLPIILYIASALAGGIFVARNGWATLRATHILDINALMTIAATGALLIGEYAEAAAVVFLFALGNALEGYTMERARRSIRALINLAPTTALVLRGGTQRQIPVEDVAVGELIIIRPGDIVPLDASVTSGQSTVNQAPITGESMPVEKQIGAPLFAGSINGEGALEARVTQPAQESTLARIIHMVESAQARKAPAQRFIDQFARLYTPSILVLALLVALLPPLLLAGDSTTWLYRALVLLVIACPCALVISTPVSIVSAISAGARSGVLFKGGAALEAAGGLRALAFDKTGTLTVGHPTITDLIILNPQLTTANLLSLAAAVERRSAHPLARAIVATAEERGLPIPTASDFQSHNGRGASAIIDERRITIGNRTLFEPLPAHVEQLLADLEHTGNTIMLIGIEQTPIGIIAVSDHERAESRPTIAELTRLGIGHIAMLTGDTHASAVRIAERVGISDLRAGLLPHQKLAAVDQLLAQHHRVGMIGDGINDAPALAHATIGIAMGVAGSGAALETADITLMSDDLTSLPFAIGLSRAARRVIIQNIAFALAVKAIFLAATLLGVATLWMAVFADTGAALIVIANGMRLLRHRRVPLARN